MTAFGCVDNTIRCSTGTYFDLADPKPEKIDIQDIACALSKICRFGGQIEWFYSVAEHSVNCAKLAEEDGHPPGVVLAVLLHDAAEAYCGDMVKPLKEMIPQYKVIETRVERAVAAAFNVDFESHKAVIDEIDHAMLIHERRQLFPADQVYWTGEDQVRELDVPLSCYRPDSAQTKFILMFHRFVCPKLH